MGILVDNSGSMRDKRAAVNTAALDLVKASNREDEAFIVNFSDEAFIDQDFTSDIGKLRDGLAHIDSKGGTALYDAVVASADQLAEERQAPQTGPADHYRRRRQCLDLQPRADHSPGAGSAGARSLLDRPVVRRRGGAAKSRRAKRALKLLSDETGGIAFFPKSLADVDHDRRRSSPRHPQPVHHRLPLDQAALAGRISHVKVEARAQGHGKLFVRTRSGYYPKPVAPESKSAQAQ